MAELYVLNTAPDPTLDALTLSARLTMGVEGAFISLVDCTRQWLKSSSNVTLAETPREDAFCAHTIRSKGPLVVPDATADARFCDSPHVVGAPHIRMYVGIPLHSPCGEPIGVLAIVDSTPRLLSPQQLEALAAQARVAEELLRAQTPTPLQLQLQQGSFDPLSAPPRVLALRNRIEQRCRKAEANGNSVQLIVIQLRALGTTRSVLGPALYRRAMHTLRARLQAVSPEVALEFLTESTLLLVSGEQPSPLVGRALVSVLADRLRDPIELDAVVTAFDGFLGSAHSVPGRSAEELISRARLAAQEAEQRAQQAPFFFSASLRDTLRKRDQITGLLRGAAERGEMRMVYQPKVCPYTHKTDSVEALLRWDSAAEGPISPGQFIPLAERSGLIIPLGRWLMRQACQEAAWWHRQGFEIRVAINVSAVQLKQRDFTEQVAVALLDAGLPPEMLEIELTESALIDAPQQTREMLLSLRELGVQLALDDFGTGYSSLSQLRLMPLDAVKIDRSFVRNIDTSPDDAALFMAVSRMLHDLGMKTIVEGVENEGQLALVRAARCHLVQGWLYSRALSCGELLPFLRNDHPIP